MEILKTYTYFLDDKKCEICIFFLLNFIVEVKLDILCIVGWFSFNFFFFVKGLVRWNVKNNNTGDLFVYPIQSKY